jgi:hypothetical protein
MLDTDPFSFTQFGANWSPVERVGEYGVTEADGGGENVDRRNTRARHYGGLIACIGWKQCG